LSSFEQPPNANGSAMKKSTPNGARRARDDILARGCVIGAAYISGQWSVASGQIFSEIAGRSPTPGG
jgi:hypothetical protein